MESDAVTETVITLKLNKTEAWWLKRVVQNSVHEDEGEFEQKIRQSFWNALKDAKL